MTDPRQLALSYLTNIRTMSQYASTAALLEAERQERAAVIAALTADLAAKVEPVAWAAQNTRSMKYAYIWHEEDDVRGWINLQHQSSDWGTYRLVPLYAAPQQAVPAGFVLVPIEPTHEMGVAAQLLYKQKADTCTPGELYKAMINSAPRPAP